MEVGKPTQNLTLSKKKTILLPVPRSKARKRKKQPLTVSPLRLFFQHTGL